MAKTKITVLPDGSCFAVVRSDKAADFIQSLFDPQIHIKRKKNKSKSKNKNGNSKNKGMYHYNGINATFNFISNGSCNSNL